MSGFVRIPRPSSRPFAVPAVRLPLTTKPADQESIAALEARIAQAQPREQCYLYAELIHQMTEFSVQAISAGDVEKANSCSNRSRRLTHKIHLSVAENDKRLKNAEILLRHTAFRLNEMLHNSSSKTVLWSSRRLPRSTRLRAKPCSRSFASRSAPLLSAASKFSRIGLSRLLFALCALVLQWS